MILPPYHTHTYYCDGAEAPEKYVEQAIRMGVPAYGFSSHAPVPFITDWNVPDDKLNDYFTDIEKLKSRYKGTIEIYKGLEIDFIPGLAGRNQHILKDVELDYFIGSIHFVDQFPDGRHWNIDTSFEMFEEGLHKIFHSDFPKAATRFYELSRQMIEEDTPDVIGHFDKIKMFNQRGNYFSEQESWYRAQIDELLQVIKKNNTIVEINTRGFYKYNQVDLYPSEWILEKMHWMGIPIMINSDAHHPSEIVAGIEYAAAKLKNIGFNKTHVLLGGKWKAVAIADLRF